MVKKLLIALCTLFLLGCATPYNDYTDEFSEVHMSMDGSRAMFIGRDKYLYLFDAPDSLGEAITLPFAKKMSVFLRNDRGYFFVQETGSLQVDFDLTFRLENLSQIEVRQLLADGFVEKVYHNGDLYLPQHLAVNCKNCRKLVPNDDRLLLAKHISMSGKRYLKSGNESLEKYDASKLPYKKVVYFRDLQNKSVDFFAPSMAIVGTASCLAVAPVCFAAAVPMMGLKP